MASPELTRNPVDVESLIRAIAHSARAVGASSPESLDRAMDTACGNLQRAGLAAHVRSAACSGETVVDAWPSGGHPEEARARLGEWARHLRVGDAPGPRVVHRVSADARLPFQTVDRAALAVVARPPGGVRCLLLLEADDSAAWPDAIVDLLGLLADVVALAVARREASNTIEQVIAAMKERGVKSSSVDATRLGMPSVEVHDDVTTSGSRLRSDAPTSRGIDVSQLLPDLPPPDETAKSAPLADEPSPSPTEPRTTPAKSDAPTRVDGWMDQMKLQLAIDEKIAAERARVTLRPAAAAGAPSPDHRPSTRAFLAVAAVVVAAVAYVVWTTFHGGAG